MSSRARIFAAVTLLISCLVSCLASPAALAQVQNLEAGKSPSQLFAGTCNACHKSPRGLLKTVSPGSLPGFLREHYTTSGDMASQLATYLISNGAGDKSKQGADKPGQGGNDQADRQGRKNRNAPSQEAARPEDVSPPGDSGRQGRRRQARPGEAPEEGRPGANAPSQADTERGPDGRRLSAKQRNRIGKPPGAEEPSIANEPPKAAPAKDESGADDKAKGEPRQETGNASARPTETKPAEVAKPEPAKPEAATIEPPKDGASGDKPNPVPAVTSAVPAAAPTPAPAAAPAATSSTTSGGSSEPAPPRAPAAASPSGVTASAPPPAPTGPPAPPISQ
jgi:hypothetical protein